MAVECELEDLRPGNVEMVAQGANVGSDQPQVLREEGKTPQLLLYRGEKLGPRPRHPLARLGSRRPGGYVPGRREGAEVIEPNRVHVGQQGAQPIDAPAKTGPTKRLPVIDGVAPELPLGAEIVWRHAGHKTRLVLLVQQEQLRVGPDVT